MLRSWLGRAVRVSTVGAISFRLVSEFLPLFGWALHKPLG